MNDLQKGTTLIEASAGTGKTYRLCRIALQLTLQHGITLDRILAVTFTEAATEELASRIQKLYQGCLRELETGDPKEDVLLECLKSEDFDVERAKNALRYSLEVFDEAPISTIHSFCKRCLELVALETQNPLDAELSQIEDDLIVQLQGEYIRQHILEASSALSLAYEAQKDFEKRLKEISRQTSSHPDASLRPIPTPISIDSLERRFRELPEALSNLVDRSEEYLKHLGKARKPAKQLSGKSPGLLACVKRGFLLPADLGWLGDFSSEAWSKAMNKSGQDLPLPPVTALIDVVLDQIESAYLSLIYNYRPWLSGRLERAKQQANVISFNDLLHHLQRALTGEEGTRIIEFLAGRYDAALIDEFQDTDRTQLKIARSLFGHGEHYLFYIGDPKQAIYRFRGADIYAYFQATQGEGLRNEILDKNYRSAPKLVEAVNALFESSRAGFVDERISFRSVESGLDAADFSSEQPPFRIVQLRLENPSYPKSKSEYRNILAERAANDFAKRLNESPELKAEDVSFLVNDRIEAAALSEALLQRGISAAIHADRSVFKTQEAIDLKQLLAALVSPARTSLKRGACAALDHSLSAVSMRSESFENRVAPVFEYITEWARDWHTRNFDVALHGLLRLLNSEESPSGGLDTERRHANICQLGELLSEARDAEELSPRGLYNWLCRKTEANVSHNEEWQTRISSDERKPQILTVHKSKGLQFPYVILPFLGLRRVRLKELASAYHGPEDELIIDYAPSPDSPASQHARREALAEDIRLLYVALTRAEHENLVYLCPEELSRTGDLACSSFAQFLLDEGERTSSDAVAAQLHSLAEGSNGSLAFEQSPLDSSGFVQCEATDSHAETAAASENNLQNRARMPFVERVLSFSALNKGMHRDEDENSIELLEQEESASDELNIEPEAELEQTEAQPLELSIFTLPKGTHAGDLLHLILERFDFSRPETLSATTQQAFDALQFEPRDFEPIVAAQISSIAKANLKSQFTEFTLEQISPDRRIPELEFSYPVSGDVKSNILSALSRSDLGFIPTDWLEGLSHSEAGLPASMLRGFIDLVLEHDNRLYIFDWKSNYLGPTPADYDQAAILESMGEHNYFLQYLLYCVALKRYAEWRFPGKPFEESFGGVFYIYVRGISPGKETGIFYDLPSPELLQALDEALYGGVLA
ncbi:UvrD/REP helicase domain protein [Verrucomicrobiia bacterium DG1235]|nr:UvrD/REP helicase domain protein [Verrucomicrobiae bacterium DG1235]